MTAAADAPAKLNLWLRVGDRRPDGFHDLDTLFCALELADAVRVEPGAPGSGVRLEAKHAEPLDALPELGPADRNLAVRAARAASRRSGQGSDLRIRLLKRIPVGGGLGGGSSDAAATVRAFRTLFPGGLETAAADEIAAELGSDVPFFLAGHPLAFGRGRGTRLEAATPLPPRPVVLVLPGTPIATAAAYAWLDEDRERGLAPPPADPLEVAADTLTWDRLRTLARNDFEAPVFRRHPDLARQRDALLEAGAAIALLAGSGSTLFGQFDDDRLARAAVRSVGAIEPGARTVLTRTRS